MSALKQIGLILDDEDMSYATMNEVGKVTIEFDQKEGRVEIVVEGFEFSDPPTCRTHAVRGLAWARDILAAQIEVEKLTPGGHVRVAVN